MKKAKSIRLSQIALAGFAALALSGCGEDPAASSVPTSPSITETPALNPSMEALFLPERPEGAQGVKAVRDSLQPGDRVIVEGRIGGVTKPFTEGFATFVMADDSVEFCVDDGHCPTPWDACCDDPDKIKAARIAVQVTDPEGLPLATTLQGAKGLEPGVRVTVVGEVAPQSDGSNFVVNAVGIHPHTM